MAPTDKSTMIHVQPLKRSEMQVNLTRQTVPLIHIFIEYFCYISLPMLRILELVKLPMEFMVPFCKD